MFLSTNNEEEKQIVFWFFDYIQCRVPPE